MSRWGKLKLHDRWALVACLTPFLVFAVLYGGVSGRGFVSDDFEWALRNRCRSFADIVAIVHRDNGFYRPAVASTFALNEYLSEANPKLYGLTNVFLALACCFGIHRLCRALALPMGAGILAAAIWLFNFYGVNMAVLWISGRTALLVTLGATMCVAALIGDRPVSAALWFALALFSKEEAITMPLVGAAWLVLLQPQRRKTFFTWLLISGVVVALYLWLRSGTGAMTPSNAPTYYRFTFAPAAVVRNIFEYADRTLTFSLLVTVLALGILRWRPTIAPEQRRILYTCICWIAATFAITVFLPARSSLYVCLPAVGSAVAAAVMIAHGWAAATEPRRRRAIYAAIVVPFLLAPIHYARGLRYIRNAEFSRQVLSDLAVLTSTLPTGAHVVLNDTRTGRVDLNSAFGALLDDAFFFSTHRRLRFWIEPPITYASEAGLERPCAACVSGEFTLRDGRLTPTASRTQ